MRGLVDDLKAVTSGQWLREQTFFERSISATATVLVYVNAALASNVAGFGKVVLLVLLICSVGLLAITNEWTERLVMQHCIIEISGERKQYERRLELVEELLSEVPRVDWAMRLALGRLGMTVSGMNSNEGDPNRSTATM
jgi:hypothetical protein